MSSGTKIIGKDVDKKIKLAMNSLDDANLIISGNIEFGSSFNNTIFADVSQKLGEIFSQFSSVIVAEKEYISQYKSAIENFEKISNNISSKKSLKSVNKNYKKLISLVGKDEANKYVKSLNLGAKFSKNAKSIVSFSSVKSNKTSNKTSSKTSSKATSSSTFSTVVSKPVAVSTTKKVKSTKSKVSKKATSNASAVASLKKALKNSLKSGDASAVSLYGILVSAIGKKNANKYVSKLGYRARYKDGTVVAITKKNIQASNKTTTKQTVTNSSETSEQDSTSEDEVNTSDVEDNTTSDIIDTDNNTEDDSNSNVDSDQNTDDNSGTVTEVVAEEEPASDTSDTSNSSSNNENYNGDTSYEESSNNEAESTSSTDSESTENDTSNGATLGTEEDDSELDDTTTEKKASKVVTIDDDSDTDVSESSSGKSSGLGVAVPLGLGAIGTGAAAVAGVRYVKNRHDNSEEYQDDYDDTSMDDFGEESQYVDSAQYESDDLYDDQYSGPAGSTYQDVDATVTDDFNDQSNSRIRYVDPEELESDNFKEPDEVLNELNSDQKN